MSLDLLILKVKNCLVKQEEFELESKTIHITTLTRNLQNHPHLQFLPLYPHALSPSSLKRLSVSILS